MFSFHRNHRLQGRDGEAWCSTLAGNCDTCCLSGVCVVPQPHPASRVLAALPLTTLWHTVFLQRRSRRDACAAGTRDGQALKHPSFPWWGVYFRASLVLGALLGHLKHYREGSYPVRGLWLFEKPGSSQAPGRWHRAA